MNSGVNHHGGSTFRGVVDRYKGRVLISGTQNDTRSMMRVLLEMWGYEVDVADGAEDTVERAEAFCPHAVLVDTTRRFNEDIKVVSRLRLSTALSAVPVFVMSGFSQPTYEKTAFDHGATGLLVKPLDLDLLEEYLESASAAR
jgi:DNA-binding response OmpR family regulator